MCLHFELCPSTAQVQCVNYKMVPTLCSAGMCWCDVWSVCAQLPWHCSRSETWGEENSLQTDLFLYLADGCVLQKTWIVFPCLQVVVQKFSRSIQLRAVRESKCFQGTAVSWGLFFWLLFFVKAGGSPPVLLYGLTLLWAAALLNASISENCGIFGKHFLNYLAKM